ncbi:HD domain-containing protein [Haloparvum sedimenti]|uniref:HD domain-containing protein n=1 Tax=Haloparvum sedimenti TaxID=1678448 RepID=UPI00071E8C93|nr:HD domain-containing protein [Haloparvum sedimenti]
MPEADDDDAIDALIETYDLKDERRTGWQLRGVAEPETVAAHSWGVAYLVLAIGDRLAAELAPDDPTEPLLDEALRLAVVHDAAEAETGDVATRADPAAASESPSPEEKEAAERAAMGDLAGPLPDRVRAAWEAYEARETPAARLVKECDLIDLCLQALAYERAERYDPAAGEPDAFAAYDDLDEFFATAEPRLRTDAGRALVARIRERYEAAKGAGKGAGDKAGPGDHS